MKTIALSRNMHAQVDDCDYESMSAFRWHALRTGGGRFVAASRERGPRKSKRKVILMHRLILGVCDGLLVDHRNGDPLDNRRSNLRACTPTQNLANQRIRKHFKGVYGPIGKKKPRWRAYGFGKYLGTYDSAKAAALAYDSFAKKEAGEFAVLNFPERLERGRITEV